MNRVYVTSYFAVSLSRAVLSDEVPVFSSKAAQNAMVCTVLPSPCTYTAAPYNMIVPSNI